MRKPALRLPYRFDVAQLTRDLRICEQLDWVPHFNTADYSGGWSSISLRSASGAADDILSHPEQAGYRDTPLLAQCPYFSQIMSRFECEMESVRLLNLAPGGHIREHSDVHAGYRYGFFRVHVPLQTSGQVRFVVGGEVLPMQAGECWYADFSLPHSVENRSDTGRVNLVLDCRRNAWSDRLFEQAGYDFAEEAQATQPDAATRAKMIAELENMGGETARMLIRQLQEQAR